MSEDSYRREINRLKGEIAKLEKKQADERGRAAKAQGDANRLQSSITKYTSPSAAEGKLKQMQRKLEEAARYDGKAADIGTTIARKAGQLESVEKNLSRAQGQTQRRAEQQRKRDEEQEKKRRREEEQHLRAMARQQQQLQQRAASERRAELAHERALTSELGRRARYAESVSSVQLRSLPQRVTILFASAGPRDELRVDIAEEARDVQKRLRASEHRDVVELRHVPALRPSDLIPALNEHKPRVVHFAGHGSRDGQLVFQDDGGNAKPVDLEAIAATIATVADDVQLVVLNACHSSMPASALVEHVPVAIGMSEAIGDDAARLFAIALYGAIADGFSVERAFAQGLAQLKLDGLPDIDVPCLFTTDGVDADSLVLVRPPDEDSGGLIAA
jgi:CHAT domain